MDGLQTPRVGWLDVDARGQRDAVAFLASIRETGTSDELGFGAVRQVYASLFFPATNTQMRRAIYFFTIPQMCVEIRGGAAPEKRLHQHENALRRAFERSGATDGIIGVSSKDALVRHPSSIYWRPLQELDILRSPIMRSAWLRGLGGGRLGAGGGSTDDGTFILGEAGVSAWDSRVLRLGPVPSAKIPQRLKPDLDLDQAEYLRERFFALDRNRGGVTSLMGHLLKKPHDSIFDAPWEAGLGPASLRKDIQDAKRFSLFARGATLHYNHLVTQAKHLLEPVDHPESWMAPFTRWWEAVRDELLAWDLLGFEDRLKDRSAQVGLATPSIVFCKRWIQSLSVSAGPKDFLVESGVAGLVRAHERDNRPGRARLSNPGRTRSWGDVSGTTKTWHHQLLYRAPRASMLLADIVAGLRQEK